MRKGFLFVGVILLTLGLTACTFDVNGQNDGSVNVQHEHTFSSEWTFDKNKHWHESTCGHDVRSGESEHVIVKNNQNGITTFRCSVCGYSYTESDSGQVIDKLVAPTGLQYVSSSKSLEWGVVSGADSYVLSIDNRERSVTTNYYDVSTLNLNEGEHKAKVKSANTSNRTESNYSNEISFVYELNVEPEELAKNANRISQKNIVNKRPNYETDYKFGQDNDNYYFVFHLGTMENVPLTSTYEYKYYGGQGYYKEEFTVIKTESESISNTVATTDSHYHEYGNDQKGYANISAQTSLWIFSKIKVSGGWEGNWHDSNTDINTVTTTYSNASSFTMQTSTTKTYVFDSSMPAGYYSYRFVGVLDKFMVAEINKEEYAKGVLKVKLNPVSSILGYGFSLDYDPNTSFVSNLATEKFEFNSEFIWDLVESHKDNNAGDKTIYLYPENGSSSQEITVDVHNLITNGEPTVPVNNGYIFAGYYTEQGVGNGKLIIDDELIVREEPEHDARLYAHWIKSSSYTEVHAAGHDETISQADTNEPAWISISPTFTTKYSFTEIKELKACGYTNFEWNFRIDMALVKACYQWITFRSLNGDANHKDRDYAMIKTDVEKDGFKAGGSFGSIYLTLSLDFDTAGVIDRAFDLFYGVSGSGANSWKRGFVNTSFYPKKQTVERSVQGITHYEFIL